MHFGLKGDIKKAHRRVKIRKCDWGRQACKLREETVWLNVVGTFGVGSASYWWARLFGCCARGLALFDVARMAVAAYIFG